MGNRTLGVLSENPLQNLPIDWLLKDRDFAEPAIDTLGIVSGHEDERHAAYR